MSRVAIVTGSNKGIGFAIIRALCFCKKFNGDVYLTARNEKRGLESVDILKKEGLMYRVGFTKLNPKFHALDISSEDSVSKFRDFLKSTHKGIDILINNAGIAHDEKSKMSFHDQAKETINTNFFGTMNVCDQLFPLLRVGSRVVNVSSSSGLLNRINGKEPKASELRNQLSDPNLTKSKLVELVNTFLELTKSGEHVVKQQGYPVNPYVVSKVAISFLTRIQQKELDETRPGDRLLVNSVHPGYVSDGMSIYKGPLSPDEGAIAPLWLAMLPPDSQCKGQFYWFDKTVVDYVNGPTSEQMGKI